MRMNDAEIREWVREHRELFVNEELAYNSILSRAFVTSTGHAFNCTSTYVAKEDTCACMKLRLSDIGIILDKLLRNTHGCGCCWTDQDQYEESQRISEASKELMLLLKCPETRTGERAEPHSRQSLSPSW